MIQWQFILNPDSDNLTIEEPVGWLELEQSLQRDDKVHGMRFEASTGALQFYGSAADFLKDQKILYGLKSNVILQASLRCAEEDSFEEILKGRLNFGRYKEDCGTDCFVTMPIEEDSCAVVFKNRYDQKVDIDNPKAFDNFTMLPDYAGLDFPIDLPAKELFVAVHGQVALGGSSFDFSAVGNSNVFFVRPVFSRKYTESIDDSQLEPTSEWGKSGAFFTPVSPVLLFNDNITCFTGDFDVQVRLKGSYNLFMDNRSITDVIILIYKTTDPSTVTPDQVIYLNSNIDSGGDTVTGTFDETFSSTITIGDGFGFYVEFRVQAVGITSIDAVGTLTWDEETEVNIFANKNCPATVGDAYLVHETLSRVTEAITNQCMRAKSAYYGRTDSQPFSFPDDGCGSLRMLTSGLKLRNAPEDKFFASMKELMEGLTAIDNIGFAIEEDTILGKFILRIEDVEFFYQDIELLKFDFITSGTTEVEEAKHYAKIEVGYTKWEVERINGLDEFNSIREYRTSLDSVSSVLDIKSNLITGSYPYEVTRQQSFADTGGADTKYDNDIFLICLIRNSYFYEVEQGNITNPANIYSPNTVLNYRLSPVRNLMRWFKSIIPSYANYTDSDNKLYFSAGTGNLIAEGEQTSIFCKLENGTIKENQNISTAQFVSDDYLPIWKNELVSFEYPLSVGQYRIIKANPYGYISFQCGTGAYEKGYIKEIKYKPAQGTANFTLRKKYVN